MRPCRPGRRFRPTIGDDLEPRLALSSVRPLPPALVARLDAAAARRAAARPALTTTAYRDTLAQVDAAFAEYEGRDPALRYAGDFFGGLGKRLLGIGALPRRLPVPANLDPDTDPEGNLVLLRARLNRTVARIPNGRRDLEPLILAELDPQRIRPANADFYRDRIRTALRRHVVGGVQAGRFTLLGD